jgi:hypothetical protein
MGIEYALRFAEADPGRVAALLRSLPTARELPPPYQQQVGLGGDPSGGGWPAATVMAEAGGAYFCDHCGGMGPEYLGVVVAWLVGEFGPVTVSEL